MKLCIPCFVGDKIYIECEISKPKGGTLADTSEIMQREGVYNAIVEFLQGCIKSFSALDGSIVSSSSEIKKIIKEMPYQTAEDISLKIMGMVNPEDKIEGVYPCPRCGKKIVTGIDPTTGEDTRDEMQSLEATNLETNKDGAFEEIFYITLDEHVFIKDSRSGETIEDIYEIGFKYPTIQDCINGFKKFPVESTKSQYAIYASAIKTVNGGEKSLAYKATWGQFILNNLSSSDIKKIGDVMKKYGIAKTKKRTCSGCGKIWDAVLDTTNFFASGLQSE